MVVYRCAAYYPDLVTHVFSVCTPYMAPSDRYFSTEELVQGPLPQFGYQLHLAGPEVEAAIQTPESISRFLAGMYGARTEDGKVMFSPEAGIDFDVMNNCSAPLLLTKEVRQYHHLTIVVVATSLQVVGIGILRGRILQKWHAWSL